VAGVDRAAASLCGLLRRGGVPPDRYAEALSGPLALLLAHREGLALPGGGWSALLAAPPAQRLARWRALQPALVAGGLPPGEAETLEDPALFSRLVEALERLPPEAGRPGALYEAALAKTSRARGAGQFFTPEALVSCLVERLAPGPGERALDPACGAGGFLVAAARRGAAAIGLERDPQVARLARAGLWLRGLGGEVRTGDALGVAGAALPQADVVLMNPPFGGPRLGAAAGWPVPTADPQLAFLQLALARLAPAGRAALVLSDGALGGGGDGPAVRRAMLARFDLHTVLRLPLGIFYAPQVRASALFLTRGRPTGRIRLFDLRAGARFGRRRPLGREDLAEFEAAWDGALAGAPWEGPRQRVVDRGDLGPRCSLALPGAAPPRAEDPSALAAALEGALTDAAAAARSLRALVDG
jgi:type I restriction enzyme M protein